LGDVSRRQRFAGPKPRLSDIELAALARVDRDHHVLVAYTKGSGQPAGLARLVRQGQAAEGAFGGAEECRGLGIGTALVRALAADARAAGIVELRATVAADNRRALSLLSRCTRRLRTTWLGNEVELVAALD